MKNLLTYLLFLCSLFGISQTTTFNEGWDTEPKTILTMGPTTIVYETNTEMLGRYGKLIKYRVLDDKFIKLNQLIILDTMVDFRFDGEKLHLIFLEPDQCDVGRNDSIWVYTVDTSTFNISAPLKISKLGRFEEVSFANDSVLFLWDQLGNSKLYSLRKHRFIDSKLWYAAGNNNDFCTGLFGGQYILTYSSWMGLTLEPTMNSMQFPYYYIGLPENPVFAYSYGLDSLLVIAGDSVYKMDTTMISMKTLELPAHDRFKAVEDQLFLFNGNYVQTLALPECNVTSIDTLKGLPAHFSLADVYPTFPQELAALAGSKRDIALNEMILKSKIENTDVVKRHKLRIDSMASVDTVDISVSYGGNYNVEVTYRIYCSNEGTDTIHNFELLYSDFPYSIICGPYVHKLKSVTIPPGETISFDQKVKMYDINRNVCFYVSVPDNRLEDDLNDNKICSNYYFDIKEIEDVKSLALYPNPTAGTFHLEGDFRKLKSFFLFTLDGRRAELKVIAKSESAMALNLEGVPAGVYFLHLHVGDDVIVKKIIKHQRT